MIKEVIDKFFEGKKPSLIEYREVFDEIYSGLADEIQSTSFLTLLDKEGFNEDAIFVALEATKNSLKLPQISLNSKNLIENLSFNSGEYIDISLAQDLICSACDLGVVKYNFNPKFNNSFKTLDLMGVNINKIIDYSSLEYEKLAFNYISLSQDSPYFKYAETLRLKLPFDNIFNVTSKLLNPFDAKNMLLGIKDKNLVEKYASLALKLQKNNSIIVSGDNNFAYISPNGESFVAEAWKNKIFTYVITPELLGIKNSSFDEIKVENIEQNAQDLVDIFENNKKGAKYDIILLNTALSLYISKCAPSIMDGLELAKKTIDEGKVKDKLEQLRKFYS